MQSVINIDVINYESRRFTGAGLILGNMVGYRDTQGNTTHGRSVDDTSILSMLQWFDDSSIHFDIAVD